MRNITRSKPQRIPFTEEGYQKIKEEKDKLLHDRPEAVEHLRKAREMGDLSENGYYKASRAKLSSIDSQLRHLEKLLRLGQIIPKVHTGYVDVGSTVVMSDGINVFTYTIVGGYESNPNNGTISYLSPLGKSVMGKKVGDMVTVVAPQKTIQYTIREIR